MHRQNRVNETCFQLLVMKVGYVAERREVLLRWTESWGRKEITVGHRRIMTQQYIHKQGLLGSQKWIGPIRNLRTLTIIQLKKIINSNIRRIHHSGLAASDCWSSEVACSKPAQGMITYICSHFLVMLSCIGRVLGMGRSPSKMSTRFIVPNIILIRSSRPRSVL
jgi:hypothetical protein